MEKILYTDFQGIDSLIDELINVNPLLKKAMKRSTLYSFWNKVVGKPFDKKSKPYGTRNGNIMVVACESSVVVQELNIRKKQILKKLQPYLSSLRMTIKDIVFDVKKWGEIEKT